MQAGLSGLMSDELRAGIRARTYSARNNVEAARATLRSLVGNIPCSRAAVSWPLG
jgi:hypothetical protein